MRLFWFKMFQSGMDYQLCDIIAIWLVSIMFVINMRNSELKYKKNTILESSSLASKTEIIFLNISNRLVKKRALYAEWSIWGTIFQFLALYASSSCSLALTLSLDSLLVNCWELLLGIILLLFLTSIILRKNNNFLNSNFWV